jgi:hypothetical protein
MSQLTPQTAVVKQLPLSGKTIQWLVRNESAKYKGSIAAKLVTGQLPYHPTPAEAARIVGTHARVVHAALGHQQKPPTDRQINRLIERIGRDRALADRVLAAIDRFTAPELLFVEAA